MAAGAVREGQFREELDVTHFAFEVMSLILGYHYYSKLLLDPEAKQRLHAGLNELIARYSTREGEGYESVSH